MDTGGGKKYMKEDTFENGQQKCVLMNNNIIQSTF